MRRGLGTLEIVIGSIVILALAGVLIGLLTQTDMQGTVSSLQSCDEGIITSTAGPLLGENSKMKCFSSRSEPKFPKGDEDCPDDFKVDNNNNSLCVASGDKSWQYLLKLGCTDEAPYCWAQTDEVIGTVSDSSE